MSHFLYLLRCADNSLYCGQTTDLDRRVKEHNEGGKKSAKYTRARLPVKLVYYEKLVSHSDALKREIEVKKMSKKEKEMLVDS